MMTASLRAMATAARLKPILSRSFTPQARSSLSAYVRVRIAVAASYSSPPQMSVAASGDVAVIIDFARFVATSGQSQPRADRTRLLEVRRVLDGGRERGCGDRANPWDRHQQLTGLALSCAGDKLPSKLGGAGAHAAPSLKNWQDDTRKLSLTDK
jgi:hypothetical protein